MVMDAFRPYAKKFAEVLSNIVEKAGEEASPLMTPREEVRTVHIVLVTSDRGLCGAYNVNIMRHAHFSQKQDKPAKFIGIGKRGNSLLARMRKELVADFSGMSERPTILDVGPLAKIAIDEFLKGTVDEVYVAYTDFINVLKQVPTTKRILPIQP